MNADKNERTQAESFESRYSDLTEKIIGVFYAVYNELGHGFLESVYQSSMAIALESVGLSVERELAIPVWFREIQVGAFRADLVVSGAVLLELKSCKTLEAAHDAQALNYLRAPPLEVALLLNFGPKPQIRRLAFSNERKKISVYQRSSAAGGLG